MAEFNKNSSRQSAKFVNSKAGVTKVLVLNSSFSGEDRNKGPLETSALHRLVIEAHEVKGSGDNKESTTLSGNIPAEKLPALLSLSEQAMHDKMIYGQERQFVILPGVWKPRMSTQDENGNVEVYSVEIVYDGTKNLAIQFKLTTLRAPVSTDNTGRMNVQLKNTVQGSKKEITFYLSAEDWYNQLTNAVKTYDLFKNRNSQLGNYDLALGLQTE